jgi:hypothetical protein
MKKSSLRSHLAIAIVLGSVWGMSEVLLGAGIQACARTISGSVMTGIALLFITGAWVAARNFYVPVLVVLVACLFKLFDASLLSLPVMHGAIGNPIFAFLLEGFAFLLLLAVFRRQSWQRISSRAYLGAGAALISVAMFPLVKFATGIPACVYPGTSVPLSIYFAPIAIIFSAFLVPLGFLTGDWIRKASGAGSGRSVLRLSGNLAPPVTLVICLALVFMFRMIVTSGLS